MSTSSALIRDLPQPKPAATDEFGRRRRIDLWMLAGVAIAVIATVAGIASTGIDLAYFFQPTGALIVLGGTLGVTLITTPHTNLIHTTRRVIELFRNPVLSREQLIDEMVSYIRVVRTKGLYALEPALGKVSSRFLGDCLLLALDVKQRSELQTALETKLRLTERQGEMDAKVLEVAGGFAPTIGVMGTVVGLIDVLRQFTALNSVATGVGTAFVSTIYGLALANLVLLPAAHRIRARVAETFEIQELMIEGTLCLFDGVHPAIVRQRLSCFVRSQEPNESQLS
ncbi:MAG TPA: MotA/TolQ/ExbB proton channel family protein [Bryobacteraceae bacterium]|nr:MotA/TolQ/ExbB proton channel family protein [Bryobacteraceae bacterium]